MREGLGFLLIPCLITRPGSPRVKDPIGPTLIHLLGPLQRALITGRRRMKQEEERRRHKAGWERRQDKKEKGRERRWTEPELKHILSVSVLSGLCGLFRSLLTALAYSSTLEGTNHMGLCLHVLQLKHTPEYTLKSFFPLCPFVT